MHYTIPNHGADKYYGMRSGHCFHHERSGYFGYQYQRCGNRAHLPILQNGTHRPTGDTRWRSIRADGGHCRDNKKQAMLPAFSSGQGSLQILRSLRFALFCSALIFAECRLLSIHVFGVSLRVLFAKRITRYAHAGLWSGVTWGRRSVPDNDTVTASRLGCMAGNLSVAVAAIFIHM